MIKFKSFAVLASVIFAFFNISAFALDQVILKNGDILEGKVLSEVPNRHVDIQLVNGTKKRINITSVQSVERDLPGNDSNVMSGSDSLLFFGANTGGILFTSGTNNDIYFNWGGRIGFNLVQMGDFAKWALAISYQRSSLLSAGSASAGVSELMLQPLFRKVGNSGFYFGPELGLNFIFASVSSYSDSVSYFNYGVLLGHEFFVNDAFSIGPEFHFTNNEVSSQIKGLMSFSFHL